MTVIITMNGKPHGHPITNIRDNDLWWLIKNETAQGRCVTIKPDELPPLVQMPGTDGNWGEKHWGPTSE